MCIRDRQSTEEEPSIVRNIPYVSVWDGGNCIAATKADVCLDTKQVFNIQTIDVGDSANVLDHEYIVLHGTEYTAVSYTHLDVYKRQSPLCRR